MLFIGYNASSGPCADAALRRALDRGFDRTTAAVALLSRHAQAAALPVPPDSPLYDETLAQRRSYSCLLYTSCHCRSGWYSLQVHFFHFSPLPQGQGSLRPIFSPLWTTGCCFTVPSPPEVCLLYTSRCV